MDYPGQTKKIQKKSLDGGVDYPGQTTKIEKKVLDGRVDYPGNTYQSVLLLHNKNVNFCLNYEFYKRYFLNIF